MRISLGAGAQVLTTPLNIGTLRALQHNCLNKRSRQELLLSHCRVFYYYRRLGYYSGQPNLKKRKEKKRRKKKRKEKKKKKKEKKRKKRKEKKRH